MKNSVLFFAPLAVVAASVGTASAHVVVKPSSVGVASFQAFNTSVPNEKDVATTSLRLIVPDGLKYVSPTVKPGWTVTSKASGTGESATVTELDWNGGSIPAGQRDDFTFSAQAPAAPTTLMWKAYQTYANGQVISWDQAPDSKNLDSEGVTPYSRTDVINDLAAPTSQPSAKPQSLAGAYALGGSALLVSIAALLRRR